MGMLPVSAECGLTACGKGLQCTQADQMEVRAPSETLSVSVE
jgi:hypothetical protein